MANDNKENIISFPAIMVGVITGLAFLITCGLFATAIGISLDNNAAKNPPPALPILASLGAGLVFLLSFFIAAYIANFCTSNISKRSFIFNSLGVWSLLTMVISTGCLTAMLAINFQKIKSPLFVTEVHITKLSAVTKIDFPKDGEKEAAEQHQKNQLLCMIAWLTFMSVLLGLGASLTGGWCIHRRR